MFKKHNFTQINCDMGWNHLHCVPLFKCVELIVYDGNNAFD